MLARCRKLRRLCHVERGASVCQRVLFLSLPLSLSLSRIWRASALLVGRQCCHTVGATQGRQQCLAVARYENKNEQRAGSKHVQQCFYFRVLIFSYFFIQFSAASSCFCFFFCALSCFCLGFVFFYLFFFCFYAACAASGVEISF